MITMLNAESPAMIQDWAEGCSAQVPAGIVRLYAAPPRVGLVVGTYAAVPYIHLQLEARRRFFPDVPILIHDDASQRADELRALCREYHADFETNAVRQPPCIGDVTAFLGGLWWAQAKGIDLLLKLSRRWVFLTDWSTSLQALAWQSQYATFCSYTTTYGYGFRSECVGLSVHAWGHPAFYQPVRRVVQDGRYVFVEGYLHDFARQFERQNCAQADEWRSSHPLPPDRNGYALWTLMGTDRCERSPYFLWHDFAGPQDYFQLAQEWELKYELNDFLDPNQGEGDRPEADVVRALQVAEAS